MKPSLAAAMSLAALFVILPTAPGAAQATEQLPGSPESVPAPQINPFVKGEQTIALGAGAQVPLFMLPKDALSTGATLLVGGSMGISYQYFILPGIALGGSIGGSYNGTIGNRSLFVLPLSFRGAYWWSALPLEYNVSAELGAYLMRFSGHGMLGPFAKLGGGVSWRVSPAWSVGLQGSLWFVPEIHTGTYADLSRASGFAEISLAAFYHL
jgi:hypothetical protein